MKYLITEVNSESGARFTAGVKARDDIETIAKMNGYVLIGVKVEGDKRKNSLVFNKLAAHKKIEIEWNKETSHLKAGDELLIQFPVLNHSVLLYKVVERLKKKNVKVTLLIHDLEIFRAALRKDNSLQKKKRLKFEEKSLLDMGDKIIVHNSRMRDVLIGMGYSQENIQVLEIFDYLIPNYEDKSNPKSFDKYKPVVIAGALRYHKAKYVYDLPHNIDFNLYGVGYEDKKQKNINYFGAFQPDDLPFQLKGSFGLVWDGESCDTCTGIYGEYLKINNPHKTSLYLASGMPVIIWDKAALAEFVQRNCCGITIKSIGEIDEKLKVMSEEEYQTIKANAENIGKRLRSGYYTISALK